MMGGRARVPRGVLFFLALTAALLSIYFVATSSPKIPVYNVVPTCDPALFMNLLMEGSLGG